MYKFRDLGKRLTLARMLVFVCVCVSKYAEIFSVIMDAVILKLREWNRCRSPLEPVSFGGVWLLVRLSVSGSCFSSLSIWRCHRLQLWVEIHMLGCCVLYVPVFGSFPTSFTWMCTYLRKSMLLDCSKPNELLSYSYI